MLITVIPGHKSTPPVLRHLLEREEREGSTRRLSMPLRRPVISLGVTFGSGL